MYALKYVVDHPSVYYSDAGINSGIYETLGLASNIKKVFDMCYSLYGPSSDANSIEINFSNLTKLFVINDNISHKQQNIINEVYDYIQVGVHAPPIQLDNLLTEIANNQIMFMLQNVIYYNTINVLFQPAVAGVGQPEYKYTAVFNNVEYDLMGVVGTLPQRNLMKGNSNDIVYLHFERTYDKNGMVSSVKKYSNMNAIAEDTTKLTKDDTKNMTVKYIYYLKRSINEAYYK